MNHFGKAYELLSSWRKDRYIFGAGCLDRIGEVAGLYGRKTLIVSGASYEKIVGTVKSSLEKAGVAVAAVCPGAKPNAPKEDVYRITTYILQYRPCSIIAIGGGSTIDACKASSVLAAFGGAVTPEIDFYFGTGKITAAMEKTGEKPVPLIAVETSSSSGSHLTKYSNITDPQKGQKKLIVDEKIVPDYAFFDYSVTCSMPAKVTIDGALDAIAHTFEVFCGAKGDKYRTAEEICVTAVSLVAGYAKKALTDPEDEEAREALGLATDLGGYAIMIGGTSGPHLTSFSLVDIIGHGTACGLMNPYYWMFYSPAIQPQLRAIGKVFSEYGFTKEDLSCLSGRELAAAVAKAMIEFEKSIGSPWKLSDIPSFSSGVHVRRALDAAKDPDLKMKLQNMPVPMTSDDVDVYMAPILAGASSGELDGIREMRGL